MSSYGPLHFTLQTHTQFTTKCPAVIALQEISVNSWQFCVLQPTLVLSIECYLFISSYVIHMVHLENLWKLEFRWGFFCFVGKIDIIVFVKSISFLDIFYLSCPLISFTAKRACATAEIPLPISPSWNYSGYTTGQVFLAVLSHITRWYDLGLVNFTRYLCNMVYNITTVVSSHSVD